jgi:hypothetical protein
MQILQRQDGTLVELTDEDAAKWLKLGLGTIPPQPKPEPQKPIKSTGA